MHYKDLGRQFKRYYRTVLEKKKTHTKKVSFLQSCLPVECGQTVSGCESVVPLPGVRGGGTVWMVATTLVIMGSEEKKQHENLTKSSQR